jgi:hypothetical protein
MMQILLYMLAMFVVGVAGMGGLLLWLFGPTARTIGLAHARGDRIAQYPTDDGAWDFKRIKETDEKGRWQYETDDGRLRKLKVKKGDAKIEGGKCPMAIFPPESAVSTKPKEAYVAEQSENKTDDNKVKTWNKSISMHDIKKNMDDVVSPASLAGMVSTGIEMNKPINMPEESGFDSGTALKIGGIGSVIVIIIVAAYVAMQMGFI